MSRNRWIGATSLVLALAASALIAWTAPAQVKQATVDCGARVEVAHSILTQKCRPLPPGILSAFRAGTWEDGAALTPAERTALLAQATEAAYAEAETLTVALLETGNWPGAREINVEEGSRLVASLAPVLTRYRVRLLLDVYEQRSQELVRAAVVRALRGSELPEALLPALDASFQEPGALQAAAMAQVGPAEKRAQLLARVRRELPAGPAHDWAMRLSERLAAAPK
jgi:hypothetical protein